MPFDSGRRILPISLLARYGPEHQAPDGRLVRNQNGAYNRRLAEIGKSLQQTSYVVNGGTLAENEDKERCEAALTYCLQEHINGVQARVILGRFGKG